MTSLYDLSVTAASNTTIDGTDVSGATGKVKDGDNVMRSLGAFVAQGWQDLGGAKTTAGSANAQTVTLASGFAAYAANQVFTVKFGFTNTSSTVNLNVNSIGNARVKVNYDGVLADPIPGDLRAGAYGNFIYDGTYFVLLNAQQQARYAPGTLYGLTLSNNAGTPASKIDVAVGSCRDSGDAANIDLLSALTAKDLATTWAVGSSAGLLASGAAITNTTYHIFLIKRPDTGVVDVAADTSVTGANIAANTNAAYTLKRRIGSIVRSGGSILAFTQVGDYFQWTTMVADVSAANPGTSATSRTLTAPTGLVLVADIQGIIINTGSGGNAYGYFSSLDSTDATPSITLTDTGIAIATSGGAQVLVTNKQVRTNTSAQIRSRVAFSDASVSILINTKGWFDPRGRA